MPEGKSEIPADLDKAARELAREIRSAVEGCNCSDCMIVAHEHAFSALLAERQRCAKIAEGDAAEFDFQQALADGDDLNVGANSARLGITREILSSSSLLPSSTDGELNHD